MLYMVLLWIISLLTKVQFAQLNPISSVIKNTTDTHAMSVTLEVPELLGRSSYHNCDQCGLSSVARIIGGRESMLNEFPWMVQLKSDGEFFCGGTLISRSYILTAAHCVDKSRSAIKVILGAHNLTPTTGIIEKKVISVKKHPNFNPSENKANDIALLKLDKPVDFDRRIRPICLSLTDSQFIGKNATVIGWGRTTLNGGSSETLMKLSVPVVSDTECRDKWYGTALPRGTICAGYLNGRKDSCIGDSGGPLMAKNNGITYQVGIVSWGAGGSCALTYGVYTRITSFLEWISSNTIDEKC